MTESGLGSKACRFDLEEFRKDAAWDIVKKIESIRGSKQNIAKRRWLFELIQNAIDVAESPERRSSHLEIKIKANKNRVTFKHNAGYFTLREIRALIYSKTTKVYDTAIDTNNKRIGKFGEGFLLTHIVSRTVKVSGYIYDDGRIYKFELTLDRRVDGESESEKVERLLENINKCFEQLNEAYETCCEEECFPTEYTFEAEDPLGEDAIKAGIEELKRAIPFLLAFNDVLEKIIINDEVYAKTVNDHGYTSIVTITKSTPTISEEIRVYLKKDKDKEVQVAILEKNGIIVNLRGIPKIFTALPLVETADYISIPFVINSRNFEPNLDRDMLLYNERNEELLDVAFKLYYELLLQEIPQKDPKPGALYHLLLFKLTPDDKVEENPLLKTLNDLIIRYAKEIAENIPLIKTSEGYKTLTGVILPVRKLSKTAEIEMDGESFKMFCDLVSAIRKNVPDVNTLVSWMEVAMYLQDVLPESLHIYTLEDLKNELEEFIKSGDNYPNLSDFKERFDIDDPWGFFKKLFRLLDMLYERELVDSRFIAYMLIDQNNVIGPLRWDETKEIRGRLYLEDDIPERFKDIIKKIGWNIRYNLVAKDLVAFEIVQDYVRDHMNVDKVIGELLRDKEMWFEEQVKEWNEKTEGWVELFRWCLLNDKLYDGFPLITKDGRRRLLELNKKSFLVPFKYIGIDEEFEDLYPSGRILHEKYFDVDDITAQKLLHKLQEIKAFVTKIPSYADNLSINHEKLRAILAVEDTELPKGKHLLRYDNEVISIIPFWEDIYKKVRANVTLARLLLRFIIKHVMVNDNSWKNVIIVDCSCDRGTHKIIPTKWLADLKVDAWVPIKITENGEEKVVGMSVTEERIKKLLKDELDELLTSYTNETSALLSHLGFDELDLRIKSYSIKKGVSEKALREQISEIITILDMTQQDFNKLKQIVEDIKLRANEEKLLDDNRIIGKNVEKLIEKLIEQVLGEKHVKPIYRGGDLEIWPEGWDSGRIEITPYIMEIKFTTKNKIRLSNVQAECARDRKEHYVILVIKTKPETRNQLKNVNIEEDSILLRELGRFLIKNSYVIENIHEKLGKLPNPEEVEIDINAYWIKSKVWENCPNLLEWLKSTFLKP